MPNGQTFPCPDMIYAHHMQMGAIHGNWLKSPLQPSPEMPCEQCAAFSWCRRNCMKNPWLGYIKKDERYRANVVEPICGLIRFMGREIDRHDPYALFARLSVPMRRRLVDNEVYEYVEIMP